MCCTQLSCGAGQPKGPFIKDIRTRGGEGGPKKQKNANMGERGLVNLDILFLAFSGLGLVLIVAQAFPAFGVF